MISFKKRWKKEAYDQALSDSHYIDETKHTVMMFTDWHWRIDGMDVWPSSKKYRKPGGPTLRYERLLDILEDRI